MYILSDNEIEKVVQRLEAFIFDTLKLANKSKLVLGLSGGLDSAVAAVLAKRSISSSNMICLYLPYDTSSPQSKKDAELLADMHGLTLDEISISPMVNAYFDNYEKDANKLRRGNFMARQRMCVLFDASAEHDALVLGTSNRSEILLGYGTLYGDLACGLNPLGGLYKTWVRQVAAYIGVPDKILSKTPTGDLWPDQTDESEMGLTYAEADSVLYKLYDMKLDRNEIIEEHSFELVEKIEGMVARNKFKRVLPKIADPFSD